MLCLFNSCCFQYEGKSGSALQVIRSSFNCRSGGLKCRLEKLPCNVLSCLSGCDRKDKFSSSNKCILDGELLVNITLRLPRLRLAAVAGDILNWSVTSCFLCLLPDQNVQLEML